MQQIFGEFEGSTLTREGADELAIAKFPYKLRAEESQLYRSKWYDYRRLHPMVATCLFVATYSKAFSEAATQCFDGERGPFMTGVSTVKGGGWLEKNERLALWRLRQQADRLGLPYDFFTRRLFDYFLTQCAWSRLPRPAHLNDDLAVSYAVERWHIECRARLMLPKDPFYKVSAWIGHPYQVECEQWLIGQARSRPSMDIALETLVENYALVRREALNEKQPTADSVTQQ